jgi:hypothetical protein
MTEGPKQLVWEASQLVHSTKLLLIYVKETKEGQIGETLIIHDKYGKFVKKTEPEILNVRCHLEDLDLNGSPILK